MCPFVRTDGRMHKPKSIACSPLLLCWENKNQISNGPWVWTCDNNYLLTFMHYHYALTHKHDITKTYSANQNAQKDITTEHFKLNSKLLTELVKTYE